jgi:hypothetical protein
MTTARWQGQGGEEELVPLDLHMDGARSGRAQFATCLCFNSSTAATAWSLLLACVFYSFPTKEQSGGFPLGRMYERGLNLWIREQSDHCLSHCQDPSTPRAWGDPRWQSQGICIASLASQEEE